MSITLPANLTSKVTAVNTILGTIAESPIDSLDEVESVDAATALSVLEEVALAVQSQGWHWNREDAIVLPLADDGTIPLPANCLFVRKAYWVWPGTDANVGERARKLYNRDDHTFTFTRPLTCDLIVNLEWEEMPEYVRRYITIRAAKVFQGRQQGSSLVDRITDLEVSAALAVVNGEEDAADPQNQITGNRETLGRVWGRVRRRQN